MSYLTQTEANALFDEHLAKFPALENDINKIKTLYLTKMWHQIADVLLSYCSNTTFDSSGDGNELIDMYNKLILKMSDRFNPKYRKIFIDVLIMYLFVYLFVCLFVGLLVSSPTRLFV